MGILLGILGLIKVGIIYSLIFIFYYGLFLTVISLLGFLFSGNVECLQGLVFAWVLGLILHLIKLDMDKDKKSHL